MLYEGTLVSDEIQEAIVMKSLIRAGVENKNQDLHWPLVVKSSVNEEGKPVHFYYNYSSESQKMIYPYKAGLELLNNKKIGSEDELNLPPWEVLIVEEK